MQKTISFLIGLTLWLPLVSQSEVGGGAEGEPSPFSGTITYSISYAGGATGSWATHLPTTMQISAQGENLRVQIYGQTADSLLNEYLWLGATARTYILDHRNQIALTEPNGFTPPSYRILPSEKETVQILDHACQQVRIQSEGQTDVYWMAEDLSFPVSEVPDSLKGGQPPFIHPDLGTLPLRMERSLNGVKVTTEATSIAPGNENIDLPAGYTVKPFFMHAARHPYFKQEN